MAIVIRLSKENDAARLDFYGRAFVFAVLFMALVEAGCTLPLLKASAADDMNTARELIQQGHDVDEAFPIVGTTALMLAASHGHTGLVQALIDAGADVNARDFTGWTALHAAAYKGDPKVVILLLEHGAASMPDRWFLQSPVGMAETLGHRDLLPLLRRTDNQSHTAVPSSPVQSVEQVEGQPIRTRQDGTD